MSPDPTDRPTGVSVGGRSDGPYEASPVSSFARARPSGSAIARRLRSGLPARHGSGLPTTRRLTDGRGRRERSGELLTPPPYILGTMTLNLPHPAADLPLGQVSGCGPEADPAVELSAGRSPPEYAAWAESPQPGSP
jgi:hypothetical protein